MPKIVEPGAGEAIGTKWKYSTFFITINTNQKDFDREKLKSVLTQIYGNDTMFYALMKGDMAKVDKDWTSVSFGIEVGDKTGFVHSHSLIKLRHHTKLSFNLDLLKKVLMKELKLDGIYVNVQSSGNSEMNLSQYINKDPVA